MTNKMQITYLYSTLPAFFNALRQVVNRGEEKSLRHYQNTITRLVGMTNERICYCVSASIIRGYYNAIYAGEQAQQREARMFLRDISSILHEKKPFIN